MAAKRKNKRTSNTSNKKSRVENEEGTLTDQQYETLYKYYCENWYQKNVESGDEENILYMDISFLI